jgi:hypothetical protein
MNEKIRRDKVEQAVKKLEENTDYAIMAEMKAALNSVYGEERNQIIKPSYDSLLESARADDIEGSLIRSLDNHDGDSLYKQLITYYRSYFNYRILIHFPEITIKNEKREHLIRDMYVRMTLRPDGTISSTMEGLRTTLTEVEFISSYLHSHLPRFDAYNIRFYQFCTGVGEINQVLALLSVKYTQANFMMLLMHIKNYLEWESKEGHPYIYMENVFKRSALLSSNNSLVDSIADLAAEHIIGEIMRVTSIEEIMSDFDFSVTERAISVTPKVKLEKWMGLLIERWDIRAMFGRSVRDHHLLSLRDNEGKYYALPENMRNLSHQQGKILNFKGKDIEFQIIERSQITTYEAFANPKITKAVGKKLSSILSKHALTSAGIKSGSSLIYNSAAPKPDNISVPESVDRGVVRDAILHD